MAQATRLRLAVLEDSSVITLECLSENLEAGLRVAAAIVQDPLITGLRIDNAKEIMAIYAKAAADDAVEAGHAAAMDAFFGGRGYGGATFGTEASLKALGKKDIVSFYGLHFTRHAAVFAVSSDLGRERVQPLLENTSRSSRRAPSSRPPRPGLRCPKHARSVWKRRRSRPSSAEPSSSRRPRRPASPRAISSMSCSASARAPGSGTFAPARSWLITWGPA